MNLPEPVVTLGVDEPARLHVRRELTAFNSRQSAELKVLYESEHNTPKPVEVYARDANGEVVGGVCGEVRLSWFAVDVVWVGEQYRGQGLGRRLLRAAERAAAAHGALAATLDTMDFQARGFYEKQGYVLFGELNEYPLTHTKYLLVKRFETA